MELKMLFITTKNLDYIRNVQEITLLKERAGELKIIGSDASGYARRLLKVYSALAMEKMKHYDVVFVGFAPQLVVPLFWFKFRKCKLAIDFFISMYDTLVCDRMKIRKTSVFAKLLHAIDQRTLRLADHIIVDTKAHGAFFVSEFGADAMKIETLYLEADRSIYYPREQKKTGHADQYLVLYFGSILPLQGVETVLSAAALLRGNAKIRFLIIGPVKEKNGRYEGENIEYVDWLPQKELAERIAQADLCLAGHFNAGIEKAKRTIPGKAYIYEAMGKRMILGECPANHELFSEDDRHYYVEMGNAQALAERILQLAEYK